MQNQELAEKIHKPITRKFDKRKVYSFFKDNIWGADLADMKLISKFNQIICILLGVIDIYNKYAWVVPLKVKKGITINNAFQNFLDESNCTPNKIWINKGSQFYNGSVKVWSQDNDIEMYSTNNEGKFVVAERFIRTFKDTICKYMTLISENVYT